MRLVSRLFVFVSSLFIILYGVLPGAFKIGGDFVASFVAGRSFLHGIDPVLLYRFPVFQKMIDLSGLSNRFFSFVTSAPSSILTDAMLAIPPARLARFLLAAVNAAAFILLVHATAKMAGTSNKTAYFVFLSSSFALAANFQSGEPFIILTLLLVLAFYAYSMGAHAACGAFLGLAFPFYPILGIPVLLFLMLARWRVFSYFATVTVGILILTFIVVGQSTLIYYIQRILPAYLNARVLDPFSDSFQTAGAFLRRLFVFNETLNLKPLFNSNTAYLAGISIFKAGVIVPSAYFFYKGLSLGKPRESLAAATFPLVFISPLSSPAELIMLAPAIVILAQSAIEEGRRRIAGAFMVLYAIACVPIYSFAGEYLKSSSAFLDFEGFILLFAIYILYLVFQSRVVPVHLRMLRLGLTVVIVGAVAVTLYLGDRLAQRRSSLPLTPVLTGTALKSAAFSPGLRAGHMTCIIYDSTSESFVADGISLKGLTPYNFYRYCSGQSGNNYALESVNDREPVVYFKTRSALAIFRGRGVSVSGDEDYGAFMRGGVIHVLDLDPRYISPVDTLSLLPYRISDCSFNCSLNNMIVFLVDSLNSSCSIGTYNLFSRKVTVSPAPFQISLICADADSFFATQDVADTTILWKLVEGKPPHKLLSMRGNISDITVIDHTLYLSSDFERGLDNPTVYEYVGDNEPAPGQ